MTASVTVTNSGDGLSARATAAAALASVAHSLLLSAATASASASSDVGPIEAIYDGFDDVPAATTVDFVVGGNRKANNNHNNSINRNSHNNYNNRERSQALYMQVVNFLQRGHGDSGDDYGGGSSNGNSNSNNNYNYSHMGSAYSGNNPNNHGNNNSNNNNMSFAYDEAEAEAINRSLLLLTTTAAGASSATATATSSLTLEENATRLFGSGLGLGLGLEPGPGPEEAADGGEWSRFYDLMLSWQGICLIAVFCTFIVITIIGNTLVILAVITTRRLKTVTNCFVMSLAVADLLVGIFVMPPAVAVHLIGSWQLGWVLCDIWISLDVLLCTASILSLCAISVDRYLAVTQPLTYSRKRRSKRLALIMILIVWVLALAITCPPMFGWYEPGRRDLSECRYNQNEGYVIFSAMGSFFIPMAVMIYVYARISCVVAARHDNMTDISVHNKKFKRYTATNVENDVDHDLSEQELSSGHKKQVAARTLSNQTLAKDLHEVEILSEGENGAGGAGGGGGVSVSVGGHCSLLAISTANAKNGCYELTRPASLKRPPTASSTMTTLAGEQHWTFGGALLQPPPQTHSHSQSQSRPHSMRHHHGGGGILVASPLLDGTAPASYTTRNTRVHHHQHSKTLSNRITSLKKENKTTQTLSIVVGGFIACWLPFFVYYLITPFLEEHQVSRPLAKMLTWLGWFNSAINPFIYAFYSVDFRAAFWRLTCKRFFSGSTKPQFPTNTMSIRR